MSPDLELPSDLGIDALAQLSRLEEFYLHRGVLNDAQLAKLFSSELPLVKVTLVSGETAQQTLQALSRISTLTSLQLFSPSRPTDEAFRGVPPFQHLQHLAITTVGPERVLWLQDLPRLESLYIPPDAVTWEFIEVLRQIPNLKRIGIISGHIHDPDLRAAVEAEWELEYALLPDPFGHRSGSGAAFY
jgi:hypothetical protein